MVLDEGRIDLAAMERQPRRTHDNGEAKGETWE
jgi:hypothetical protein